MSEQNSNNNRGNNYQGSHGGHQGKKFFKGPRRGHGPHQANQAKRSSAHGPNQGQPSGQSQGQGNAQSHNPAQASTQANNNNRHQPRHHHRGHQQGHHQGQRSQGSQQQGNANNGLDQLLLQYDRLVDQHIEARKKLHELYYRCDNNRLYKLEDQFFLTAQKILKFQRELRPWQLDLLKKHRTEIYPLDTAYSSAHPEAEKFDNTTASTVTSSNLYHISPVQLNRPSYKDDSEISEGTIEDYLQYKSMLK